MSTLDMRESFVSTAVDLLELDDAVAVVLADISESAFHLAAARHPDRVINVGIREQLAINAAAGMALTGMRPIVHTIASFLVERSLEQIKLGFAHQGVGGVLVSAGASYDYSSSGRTHQAPADVALMDTLPDSAVHVPGHPSEVDTLLRAAIVEDGLSYVRTSTTQNTHPMPVNGSGEMVVARRGSRGTVLAVGPMLDPVLAATRGMDLTVLYAATVRPFGAGALVSTLTTPNVILVEPYLAGTSTRCVAEALSHLAHRVLGLGVGRVELRHYGTPDEHAAAHGLDAAGIRRSITDFLGVA
ncbi:MAG: transketolase [Ornithinibacter sp.]